MLKKALGALRLSSQIDAAKDEAGATAIEYGLIAAGIALAIITVVNNLGTTLNTKFNAVSTEMSQPAKK